MCLRKAGMKKKRTNERKNMRKIRIIKHTTKIKPNKTKKVNMTLQQQKNERRRKKEIQKYIITSHVSSRPRRLISDARRKSKLLVVRFR